MEQTKSIVEIQKEITVGIQSFEARKQELIKMASDYSLLDIKDHTDKVGYKQVDEARKQLKKERVLIEKEAKILRTPLREITALVSAKEKELIELTEPLEKSLSEKQKKYDDENEMIRLLEEKKKTDRLQEMINKFSAYNIPIIISDLDGITDEQFNEALNAAKESFEKAEAERIKKEEEEERQRLELETLRQQKLESDRKEQEKKDLEEKQRLEAFKEVVNYRIALLSQSGMVYDGTHYKFMDASVSYTQLSSSNEAEWNELLGNILPLVELRKKQQEELKQQEIENAKIVAAKKERDRIEEEARLEEIKKQQQLERDQEERDSASEKVKWNAYISELNKIVLPTFRSSQYRKKAVILREKLEEINVI